MKTDIKKILFGVLFMAIGAFLLMKNLQLLPFLVPDWVFTWQMLLIVIGLYMLLIKRRWFGGIVLIFIGKYYLLTSLWGIPKEQVHQYWPAFLILLGVCILLKKKNHRCHNKFEKKNISSDLIDINTLMSGDTRHISSYNFKGGKINIVMGGAELNLTNCTLSDEPVILDISLTMGGLEIVVPREWNVISEIIPIMGGVEDQASQRNESYIDPAAKIILRGSVVMGGIEIKRY